MEELNNLVRRSALRRLRADAEGQILGQGGGRLILLRRALDRVECLRSSHAL